MSITTGNGTSPWTKRIDRELDHAVEDQVIDRSQAAKLKGRLASTTADVDKAVRVILGDR